MTATLERLDLRPDVIARLVEEIAAREQTVVWTREDERFLRDNFGTIRK